MFEMHYSKNLMHTCKFRPNIVRYWQLYIFIIINQWNLVCGRSALAGTIQSVFSGGILFGAFFFTWLADQYGRKPVHLGTQWALIICGTICAFLPDYTSFVVLTFIRGALREVIVLWLRVCDLQGRVMSVLLSLSLCDTTALLYSVPFKCIYGRPGKSFIGRVKPRYYNWYLWFI